MIMRIFPKYHCPNCPNLNIFTNLRNDNILAKHLPANLPLQQIIL